MDSDVEGDGCTSCLLLVQKIRSKLQDDIFYSCTIGYVLFTPIRFSNPLPFLHVYFFIHLSYVPGGLICQRPVLSLAVHQERLGEIRDFQSIRTHFMQLPAVFCSKVRSHHERERVGSELAQEAANGNDIYPIG